MCAELDTEKKVKDFGVFFDAEKFDKCWSEYSTLWANLRYYDIACNMDVLGFTVDEALRVRDSAEEVVESMRNVDIRLSFGSQVVNFNEDSVELNKIYNRYIHEIGLK